MFLIVVDHLVRLLTGCNNNNNAAAALEAGSDVFEEHRPCGDSFVFEGTRGVVSDLLLYGAASTTAAQGSHH